MAAKKAKKSSGSKREQVVLRVAPDVKKYIVAKAKAAGVSVNAYCEKRLAR